jgi:peptidyl-dipeptidase Dcp
MRAVFAVPTAWCFSLFLLGCTANEADIPASEDDVTAADNPFFSASTLPFQFPPFARIEERHYGPAFEEGMAAHLTEIEGIANAEAQPTVENTIVAMERSGQLLTRVSGVFFALSSADSTDALNAIEVEMAPRLSAHWDQILLNERLFARVQTLYDQRDTLGLDLETHRLVEEYRTDFIRAGAALSAADKDRLRTLNAELAALSTTFGQHLLDEANAAAVVVDTREELAGLSENDVASAAAAAASRGIDGRFVLPLLNTSSQPALASLENRGLRRRVMEASLARGLQGGAFDTRDLATRIARLRAERAQLLGYATHADYVIERETAQTVEAVNARLASLVPPAVANVRREAADLQAMIRAEGGDFTLGPEDWAYYTERVRAERYAFDESRLRPYFEFNRVLRDGVFHAANRLYGLTFEERPGLPVYHPDILVFEVFDAGGAPLGLFFEDLYARPSKRGGAWMNAPVSQSGLLGTQAVVGNYLNVPKPPDGEPTLLSLVEVTTLFHEFGHALHALLSDVRYPYFAGTSVPRDFVEYPSQVNEMWVTWPEVFRNYAVHHETGEPMPADLLERVLAAETFNQGFATTEYLGAALLDMAWHQLTPDEVPAPDGVVTFEAAALASAGVAFEEVPPRYRSTYFRHIFNLGYSAGYYSYIWAEVLDADSVEWFRQNGGLTRDNGDHFRATVLSRGGSAEAMGLYRAFSGREPDIVPLLERRGLD